FQRSALGLVIVVSDLIEILAKDRVRTDGERLAGTDLFLNVLIECRAGDADEDQYHSEMDNVATIAARIAHGEFAHGGEDVGSIARADHARAAIKLGRNCQCDEYGKYQADQRIEFPESKSK